LSAPIQIGARRATADIAVQIGGRLASLALGVVVTLVIVRSLGDSGFGEWSTIFAITQIATNIGELGLTQITISRAASDPEHEADWLGSLLSLRLALAVPLALASALAVIVIAPSHDAELAGLLIAVTMVVGAPGALGAVFQLRIRNDVSTALLTFNSIIWAGAVFAIAAAAGGIVALAAAFLAVAVITNAATVVAALRMARVRLRGSRARWGPLLRVGGTVGLAGILVTFYVKLDQILVLEYAGSRQAGLYGAAYRILDQVQFIPAAVMTTLFPLIASSYPAHKDRVRSLLQTTANYLALASLPILSFTIVASHSIVVLLFGDQFSEAGPALPILMGAFVSISFGYLVGNMVVVLELQRRFLVFSALGLFLNATLNIILIPPYGFMAAAWITLLTEVTVMSLTARSILLRLEMTPQLSRIGRTAVAAAVMGGAGWAVQSAGAPFAIVVLTSAVVYLVAIALLRVVTLGELLRVLRKEEDLLIASAAPPPPGPGPGPGPVER
jgi:O-antigen/teichoic acid export membrane protein